MVYFLQNEVSLAIKIGSSDNVKGRFRALQTASPDPLRLIGSIDGDASTERALHRKFAKSRLRGEWFYPDLDLANEIADLLQHRGGGRVWMPKPVGPRPKAFSTADT